MDKSLVRSSIEHKGSDKSFCLVFALVFLSIGVYPFFWGHSLKIWAFLIAALFFLLGFIKPGLMKPLNHIWLKLGFILGKITTPVVMVVLYFTVFFGIALIFKLLKRDVFKLKLDFSNDTYWIKKENLSNELVQNDFKQQF